MSEKFTTSSEILDSQPPDTGWSVRSQQIKTSLDVVSDMLNASLPEYGGMTVFGSVSRGQATEASDADVYVFVELNDKSPIQANPYSAGVPVTKLDPEIDNGTIIFNDAIAGDYRWGTYKFMSQSGIDKADIFVMPISDEIVNDQITQMLTIAEQNDASMNKTAIAPRNIRGLFHAPISTQKLNKYQSEVLQRFSESTHGETAWQMMRHMVIGFEQGRDGDGTGSHREIPETLEQAQKQYRL